jgi:hypothetical protein
MMSRHCIIMLVVRFYWQEVLALWIKDYDLSWVNTNDDIVIELRFSNYSVSPLISDNSDNLRLSVTSGIPITTINLINRSFRLFVDSDSDRQTDCQTQDDAKLFYYSQWSDYVHGKPLGLIYKLGTLSDHQVSIYNTSVRILDTTLHFSEYPIFPADLFFRNI